MEMNGFKFSPDKQAKLFAKVKTENLIPRLNIYCKKSKRMKSKKNENESPILM